MRSAASSHLMGSGGSRTQKSKFCKGESARKYQESKADSWRVGRGIEFAGKGHKQEGRYTARFAGMEGPIHITSFLLRPELAMAHDMFQTQQKQYHMSHKLFYSVTLLSPIKRWCLSPPPWLWPASDFLMMNKMCLKWCVWLARLSAKKPCSFCPVILEYLLMEQPTST